MSVTQIQPVTSPADIAAVRLLIQEYMAALNVSLCFQNCEEELATLPGKYAPPKGSLLLAKLADQPAGCVALRPLEPGVCEMKRLYVRPAWRGHHLGRQLGEAIIAEARRLRYRSMRLDTLDSLKPALALYRSLGFRVVPAYNDNPLPNVIFMELQW
jgi:putative acetyltransferase